ncbi:hypothetical protein SAMN04489835_0620 [Mycolicibacterium rutilum]|uniref:Glycosyl hydrolase n=1 Tax=Mycolicibacterium rutilum TaxID=370526 RepID=A0A1H6INI5_MYCRU|nr:hypothetical protein [Mycolicibacterium rutilum]SEH50274.1 hypothetical protein SAMN04489835_0620 [Mycolicibacterium rutilum]
MSTGYPDLGVLLEEQHLAADRIEHWLLHSDIQLTDGPDAGAIAGWLDHEGRAEFVYPEIAGYYLTTLAWLLSGGASSVRHATLARGRADRAAAWIAELMANSTAPPTRRYLCDAPPDWRNDAVFSFDLAMAARGLSDVSRISAWADTRTIDRLTGWLNRISTGAAIMASHYSVDETVLPQRWSTQAGPHHLKAAAAVLRLDDAPPSLTAIAHRTMVHWATVMITGDWPCRELHALCYGIEGLLIADSGTGDRIDQAAYIFTGLMELQAPDGTLTETIDGGRVRSDVLAQALRISLLLRGRGHLTGRRWADRLDGLAHALTDFVRPDGGVLFADDQDIANTWCAMFALQALRLHERSESADPAPDSAFRYLV